jgi:hypothetical protein
MLISSTFIFTLVPSETQATEASLFCPESLWEEEGNRNLGRKGKDREGRDLGNGTESPPPAQTFISFLSWGKWSGAGRGGKEGKSQ